jgi:hypothetical protein
MCLQHQFLRQHLNVVIFRVNKSLVGGLLWFKKAKSTMKTNLPQQFIHKFNHLYPVNKNNFFLPGIFSSFSGLTDDGH